MNCPSLCWAFSVLVSWHSVCGNIPPGCVLVTEGAVHTWKTSALILMQSQLLFLSFHFLPNQPLMFIDIFISGFLGQVSCWLKLGLFSQSREWGRKNLRYQLRPMDFQKAFGKVPHQKLLKKWSFCRIGGEFLLGIYWWLNDSNQSDLVFIF